VRSCIEKECLVHLGALEDDTAVTLRDKCPNLIDRSFGHSELATWRKLTVGAEGDDEGNIELGQGCEILLQNVDVDHIIQVIRGQKTGGPEEDDGEGISPCAETKGDPKRLDGTVRLPGVILCEDYDRGKHSGLSRESEETITSIHDV
jgi:hypothetical protein